MPVERFRSPDEARQALWMDRLDPRLHQTIRSLWAFSRRLTGELPAPRGVRKFRSVEEANAEREAWEKLRVQALRRRRLQETVDAARLADAEPPLQDQG